MYQITINKIEKVVKKSQEYERIADSGNERDGKAIYGYVPCDKEVEETTELLSQKVDELDLNAVIKAINSL